MSTIAITMKNKINDMKGCSRFWLYLLIVREKHLKLYRVRSFMSTVINIKTIIFGTQTLKNFLKPLNNTLKLKKKKRNPLKDVKNKIHD